MTKPKVIIRTSLHSELEAEAVEILVCTNEGAIGPNRYSVMKVIKVGFNGFKSSVATSRDREPLAGVAMFKLKLHSQRVEAMEPNTVDILISTNEGAIDPVCPVRQASVEAVCQQLKDHCDIEVV